MPFTGLPGTIDSTPGNIVPGLGSTADGPVAAYSNLSLTQSVGLNKTINLSVNQSLSLSGSCVSTQTGEGTSTLVLSQTVSVEKFKKAVVTQALTLTQTVSVAKTYNRTVNQGLVLVSQRALSVYRGAPVVQPLGLTQSVTVTASKHTSSALVLTHSATVLYVHGARNTIELTQVVQENHTSKRKLFDVVPIFHRLSFNGTFRRTLVQPLTLTQVATAAVVKAASHTLVLTQVAIGDKVKPAFSELILSDVATTNWSLKKPFANALVLTQSVGLSKSRGVTPSNVLAMEHRARGTRVITRSVTQNLNLSQSLWRDLHVEDVNQSLVLTQDVVKVKVAPRSVSQSLQLTQSVSVAKTLKRSIEHHLVFSNSFEKVVGLPGQQTVTVVGAIGVRVQSLVILESGSGVIVLPAPEFNDKEGGNGRVNIKRAMDGTRRVYKRDQPSSRLIYDFIMDRVKAIELRTFVLQYNSSVIKMTNWKGEIWYVVLTNNPFQFTEDAYWQSSWGNKCSITLEFQGVKIN